MAFCIVASLRLSPKFQSISSYHLSNPSKKIFLVPFFFFSCFFSFLPQLATCRERSHSVEKSSNNKLRFQRQQLRQRQQLENDPKKNSSAPSGFRDNFFSRFKKDNLLSKCVSIVSSSSSSSFSFSSFVIYWHNIVAQKNEEVRKENSSNSLAEGSEEKYS